MFEAGHPCVIQWLRHPVTQPSSDLVTKCFLPFLFFFFLVAFYSSLSIRSFSLKASLRALSDWSLQSCFYLISDVFPSIQPSRSCQGELHLIRYDYSTNTIVPVMTITQSSESNNTWIITRITPNLNAYFNRYFISTYGNCCWRLYKRLVNKFWQC